MVYEDVYADEEEEEGSEVSTGEASTRRHSLNDIKGATEWPIYEEALSPGSVTISLPFARSLFEPVSNVLGSPFLSKIRKCNCGFALDTPLQN